MDEAKILRYRKYSFISFVLVLIGAIVYVITQIPLSIEAGHGYIGAVNAGINLFWVPLAATLILTVMYAIRARGVKKK